MRLSFQCLQAFVLLTALTNVPFCAAGDSDDEILEEFYVVSTDNGSSDASNSQPQAGLFEKFLPRFNYFNGRNLVVEPVQTKKEGADQFDEDSCEQYFESISESEEEERTSSQPTSENRLISDSIEKDWEFVKDNKKKEELGKSFTASTPEELGDFVMVDVNPVVPVTTALANGPVPAAAVPAHAPPKMVRIDLEEKVPQEVGAATRYVYDAADYISKSRVPLTPKFESELPEQIRSLLNFLLSDAGAEKSSVISEADREALVQGRVEGTSTLLYGVVYSYDVAYLKERTAKIDPKALLKGSAQFTAMLATFGFLLARPGPLPLKARALRSHFAVPADLAVYAFEPWLLVDRRLSNIHAWVTEVLAAIGPMLDALRPAFASEAQREKARAQAYHYVAFAVATLFKKKRLIFKVPTEADLKCAAVADDLLPIVQHLHELGAQYDALRASIPFVTLPDVLSPESIDALDTRLKKVFRPLYPIYYVLRFVVMHPILLIPIVLLMLQSSFAATCIGLSVMTDYGHFIRAQSSAATWLILKYGVPLGLLAMLLSAIVQYVSDAISYLFPARS